MLLAPVATEVLDKLLAGFLAPLVAQGCQTDRVPFSVDNRLHDRHPRLTGQIGDRTMDLDVHLIQRLLHPLDKAGALGPQSAQAGAVSSPGR